MDHVGARLRVARTDAAVTLTQMAARTNYSKSHLCNVELGKRPATPDLVLAYERVLGDSVNRRGALALAAAVVVPTAVAELIQHGFAAAIGPRRSVDDWVAQAEAYGQDYMSLGAAELQGRLAADLVVLQQELDSPHLWGVAARLMTVHGKTFPSNDGGRGAIRSYEMAAIAADRADDLDTRVWVRGRAALALAYEGAHLPVAARLAEQAVGLSERPSLGRLNALTAQAHVAAFRGDAVGSLSKLDDARRIFDTVGSAEQISDFAVPEWRFHTFESMLLSRLGHPGAVAAQEAADRARPVTLPRFATHIELHRGLMMASAGDAAGGLGYARRALDRLPPERHSLSLRLMLAEVERVAGSAV
ncbi:helix-turn-helix domain-containing protein [Plantactinospora solaniradicis]|uniref:Helix-turn-helix domain-containing protein n=1 Tax=Plantactinospora solaniradicis TaxID=1723736 RepID=A0ABW1KDY6_9ACTN